MKYLFVFFLIIPLYAFNFTAKPLITLDGVNSNFDVAQGWNSKFSRIDVFICFENYEDSQYSIYLKQIEPYFSNNILIYKDSLPQENPYISYVSDNKIGIVWQSMVDGYWQIFSSNFSSDTLTQIIQLTDDTTMNIKPKVFNGNNLYWIKNNNLVVGNLNDSLTNIDVIDSSFCSNLDIGKESGFILYEKIDGSGAKINKAWYDWDGEWHNSTLIETGNIKLLSNCYDGYFFTYQKFDSVWRSIISDEEYEYWVSTNDGYNVENAFYFVYPIPIKSAIEIRDWFVVYQSDSILNNKEIILEFVPDIGRGKMNISNLSGDDINPLALQINDSVAVIWEHLDGDSSQIYWAKEKFRPYTNIDEERIFTSTNFTLSQNYPNPFNPRTTIKYFIPYSTKISINIYNILGKRIRTVISEKFQVGNMEIVWDGKNDNDNIVSSGIYYYVLEYGSQKLFRKMVLIR